MATTFAEMMVPARPRESHVTELLLPRLDHAEIKPRYASSLAPEESFTRSGRYIYAAPAIAAYHVATRNTVSGQPWQLLLSHLLPSETRRLGKSPEEEEVPFIRYDEDMTLYTAERLNVPISIGQKPLLVIRGRKRGTVPGSIVMDKSLGPGRALKFWHVTPLRRPLTEAENARLQALMHKRGYRSSDDWKRELVFSVHGRKRQGLLELDWLDESGRTVAVEESGGRLSPRCVMEAGQKDLLIACWASKNFIAEKPVDGDAVIPERDLMVSCPAITYRALKEACGIP